MAKNNTITYNTNEQNIFFTSDTHFGHGKIIGFCDRPYENVYQMNEELVNNWNSVVGENDIVYHLGDFAFGGNKSWDYLTRLNGKIHLIQGNHDDKNIKDKYKEMFASVSYADKIIINNYTVYLNHFPYLTWGGINKKDTNIIQLHGHLHMKDNKCGETPEISNLLHWKQYDVGVDNNNYAPVSFTDIKEIFNKRKKQNGSIKNRIRRFLRSL